MAAVSPVSSSRCTASRRTPRATSIRPRRTKGSASRSSSTRGSGRSRSRIRASSGRDVRQAPSGSLLLALGQLLFHPPVEECPRDAVLPRPAEPGGLVAPLAELRDLGGGEPARILELLGVQRDLVALGDRAEPHH